LTHDMIAVFATEDEDQGDDDLPSDRVPSKQSYSSAFIREGPALLQTLFRVLEARGPKDSLSLLRDVLESMKLVQAITGTGAAASFVHANAYSDTREESFGVLTALSCILAFLALIVTVVVYVSVGLLEHEDMMAVEGYLLRYWMVMVCIIAGSLLAMMLLVAAVVVDTFYSYSRVSAICLMVSIFVGFISTVVFWISSTRYLFSSGVGHIAVPISSASETDDESESISLSNGDELPTLGSHEVGLLGRVNPVKAGSFLVHRTP